MDKTSLRRYSRVILEIGINLQKGQNVLLRGEPIHWPFMTLLTEEAYRLGARYVRILSDHPSATRARAEYVDPAFRTYVPAFAERDMQMMLDEVWCIINLDGMEDPHAYDDVNREAYGAIQQAYARKMRPYHNRIVNGGCPWVIASVPTPRWAAKVFDARPNRKTQDQLWQAFLPILKLDKSDPVAAWREQSELLKSRASVLNELQLSALRFTGPGTDLEIGLMPRSRWIGGVFEGAHKREFLPNLPTYEVFTTPDFRKSRGRVRVTRPVKVLGSEVLGAWFELEEGKVVRFGADKGENLLEQYFSLDEKSRFLGEVALVDCDSPIYKSGRLFHSILYDENAACHIALGNGITVAVDQGDKLHRDELERLGCNFALQHTDFMIGSDEVSVLGIHESGETPIIVNGRFVI